MTHITFDNFSVKLNGKRIIEDFNLEVHSGEFIVLLGSSGSGKTTILRSINGFIEPSEGYVKVDDRKISELGKEDLRKMRRKIGVIYQDFNLISRLNVIKNVLCGRLGYLDSLESSIGKFPEKDIELSKKCLKRVHMSDKSDQKVNCLSEGEKQRVAIARALAQRPKVLLADEPSANLDHDLAHDIMDLLISLWREEKETMILSTHDLGLVKEFCEDKRIVGIKSGRKIYDSPIEEFSPSIAAKIYGGDYEF